MFHHVDQSLEKSQGGLRIGLTLVNRLAEMHGGDIEAKSEGFGKGSEFLVRLPLATKPESQKSDDKTEPVSPPLSLRILIVDDNKDGADSLTMMLDLFGNETHTAYDGQEGVACAPATPGSITTW